jgi:hypothetical protein
MKRRYPRSIDDLEQRVSTEEACRDYLWELRWPEGFRCSKCDSKKSWKLRRGQYRCSKCGRQISATTGTLFHGTRIPLRTWFRAMWYVTGRERVISVKQMQREFNLGSYHTAHLLMDKLRAAMVGPKKNRPGGVVEVDKMYISREELGKCARDTEKKAMILVAAQKKGEGIGRIRVKLLPDASSVSLISAICESVKLGCTIRTDAWDGYSSLESEYYRREVVTEDACLSGNMLPLTNRVADLLKDWLKKYPHGALIKSQLEYYLDKFTFLFNQGAFESRQRTSVSQGKLFYRLIQQAVEIDPTISRNSF